MTRHIWITEMHKKNLKFFGLVASRNELVIQDKGGFARVDGSSIKSGNYNVNELRKL